MSGFFQNPHTDRTLCNDAGQLIGYNNPALSESPHGSNPLQYPLKRPPALIVEPFRIPTRIEPSAMKRRISKTAYSLSSFQNPHTDRTLCNFRNLGYNVRIHELSESPHGSNPLQSGVEESFFSASLIFQNPHTDRTLCNL